MEYPLPGDLIPNRVRQQLDPWLAQCIDCGPGGVRSRLHDRWSELKSVGMGALVGHFLNFTPHSILVDAAGSWLVLRSRELDAETGQEWLNEWYLPPPTEVSAVDEALSRFQIHNSPVLSSFLREFAGLREELPDVSGYFPRVQDWVPFEKYVAEVGWEMSNIPRV